MKKLLSFLLTTTLLFTSFGANSLFAATASVDTSELLDITKYNPAKLDENMTVRQLLYLYFNIIGDGIPESYKYIKLEFTNVNPGSSLYRALQK
jgi:hypothetical protein